MPSIKILNIAIIALSISSCAPNLNLYKNKAQDQTTEVKVAPLLDYSKQREKMKKRYYDVNFDSKDNLKIAVMLPLTGEHEKLGNALFQAMQLALFDHDDPRIHLVPFDTQGNEYQSIEKAKEIVSGNYVAIIGPVFAKNVKAIKPIIRDTGLTMITFSNDPKIAGQNVFLIGMDVKEQVRRIAEYAHNQGFEYFATLLPGNDYGSTVITELRRVANHNGSTVLKSEFYSSQTPIEHNIRNIAEIIKIPPNNEDGEPIFRSFANPEEEIELDEFGVPLYRDINEYKVALLLPEGGKKLKQILGLLERYNVPLERVQLIGLSNWYDNPAFNNPYLNNAWFTDIPHENYDLFNDHYKSYFYVTPPRISALAYDALSVVTLLSSINENSSSFDSELMTQEIGFNGISGVFRFLDTGISERLLAIYAIDATNIVKIEPEAPLFSSNEEDNESMEKEYFAE